jgi:hypothetical protein
MYLAITLFFLIFSHITLSSERNSIAPSTQLVIYNARCVDNGACAINNLIETGFIEPSVANIRWCIYTLAAMTGNIRNTFAVAQKLSPNLSRQWLEVYLETQDGLAHAREALEMAIENDDTNRAAFLLSTKNVQLANTTFSNKIALTRVSAVYWSAGLGFIRTLQLLLEAGADQKTYCSIGQAPIHEAVYRGSIDSLKTLLAYGADPDYPELSSGRTPLMLLSLCGPDRLENLVTIAIAKLLLDAGADRAKTDSTGKTAAEMANPYNTGGTRERLKNFIETYKPSEKLE